MTKADRPGFDRRMTREEINALPIRRYEGAVRVIRSRDDMAAAVRSLTREKILGFDTETRPTFAKGQSYPPALIQLAASDAVYLFHLKHLSFPRMLREVLSNPRIVKAGVALDQDIAGLKEMGSFKEAGIVDIGDVARRAGIENHGLRGLAAVLLGFRVSKQAQRSNWARSKLTPAQVRYAATDAWVSREVYMRLRQDGYLGK